MKKLRRRPEHFNGITVGMDLHKDFIQYSVLSPSGDEIEKGRFNSDTPMLGQFLDDLDKHHDQPAQVTVEASGCFLWAYDLLAERLGKAQVHVAAPSKVRVIADSMEKNDENDAWWLAYLLYEGRLPEAFVAEGELRELRIASRELRTVVDEQSDLKRRMRSHFAQLGIKFPASCWASVKGRAQLEKLVRQSEAEHGERGLAIAHLWHRIERMDQETAHWRDRVKQLAKSFDQVKQIEKQMPGLKTQLASAVFSELGDPSRYRSAKAYAKATGLTPGYRESGGRRRGGTITRCGSAHIRWALTRAVIACLRCTKNEDGLAVRRWVERMSRRKKKKEAVVAAARKLAEGLWRLFALGEAFDLKRAFDCSRRRAPARSALC